MTNQPIVKQIDGWTVRIREPEGTGPYPVMALIHGWTGDETSMWIFANRLPKDQLLIAPRGLFEAPMGGYSWHPRQDGIWPSIEKLQPATEALLGLLTPENFPQGMFDSIRLAGFSQGAALVYTLGLNNPEKVISLAGLSGFLPEGAEGLAASRPLQEKPVFVAHGTQDDTVPVERARKSVAILESAGAQVTYCEDEVGHKLSANCFRGLESFFQKF